MRMEAIRHPGVAGRRLRRQLRAGRIQVPFLHRHHRRDSADRARGRDARSGRSRRARGRRGARAAGEHQQRHHRPHRQQRGDHQPAAGQSRHLLAAAADAGRRRVRERHRLRVPHAEDAGERLAQRRRRPGELHAGRRQQHERLHQLR